MKQYLYCVIATLIVGCGGTSDSSGQDSSLLSASIENDILVVKDMKKDIKIYANIDNTEDIKYKILDKALSSYVTINENSGLLKYWADNNIGSVESITVQASNSSGWESKPLKLVFRTLSNNIINNKKIVKTGIDDNGSGIARDFRKDGDTIIDPLGNIWEDKLEEKQLDSKMYLAQIRCEILRIKNNGSNWRIPTADEMLNLIDYSKPSGSSMLDTAFEDINLTTWVESEYGQYLVVRQSNGLVSRVQQTDKYPVRCINAPKNSENHVISSEAVANSITYDFSTGLKWSPMEITSYKKIVDDVNETASEYCASYNNESGWRLPSINELRSVVENGYIANSIMQGSRSVISATPYNDQNTSAKRAHYYLYLNDKGGITQNISYVDTPFRITCVKEQ